MLHGSPDSIKAEFPIEMNDKIEKLFLKENGGAVMESLSFSFKEAVCRDCKEIVAVPMLFSLREGDKRRITGLCPSCGREKVKLISDLANLPCPDCGKKGLERSFEGLLD